MNMVFRSIFPFLLLLLATPCLAAQPAPAAPAAPAAPVARQVVTPSINDDAVTLDQAANKQAILDMLQLRLTPEEEAYLAQHRFVLAPIERTRYKTYDLDDYEFDEMLIINDEFGGERELFKRKPENARLVTPDIVLHGFHKYFGNVLEFLEQTELLPALGRFLDASRQAFLKARDKSQGELKTRYERLAAQAACAQVLAAVGLPDKKAPKKAADDDLAGLEFLADDADNLEAARKKLAVLGKGLSKESLQLVDQELQAIFTMAGPEASPLFKVYDPGLSRHDYTQYTPRGHYTKRPELRSYFRAMMFLGRHGYRLSRPEGAGDALLWVHLLDTDKQIQRDWQFIMDLTALFVGLPDDLEFHGLRDYIKQTLAAPKLDPAQAATPASLQKLQENLPNLPMPKIISGVFIDKDIAEQEKAQLKEKLREFRIFGQRFVWDGWIFEQVLGGHGANDPWKPTTGSTLMIPSALGHAQAREFLGQLIMARDGRTADQAKEYLQIVDKTRDQMLALKPEDWKSSIGTAWLGLLQTLCAPFGQGHPAYMRDAAFPIKQLQTFLGSYTELKHDTLLYAKQQYAEMGDGEMFLPPPPVPKGFVEPNLPFWNGLEDLLRQMKQAFASRKILPSELDEYGGLALFARHVQFFREFAEKELAGAAIPSQDYETLRTLTLGYLARPLIGDTNLPEEEKRSGLIADVQTDAIAEKILYTATARPMVMLALVGNENSPRLTVGLAFNHYEFTGPLAGPRFANADWRFKAYDFPESLPPKNGWYEAIIPGPTVKQ